MPAASDLTTSLGPRVLIALPKTLACLRDAILSPRRVASRSTGLQQGKTRLTCRKLLWSSPVEKWLAKILLLQCRHCADIVLCWMSSALPGLNACPGDLSADCMAARRDAARRTCREARALTSSQPECLLGHYGVSGLGQLVHMASPPLLCCLPQFQGGDCENGRWEGQANGQKSCATPCGRPWLPVCCQSFVRASLRFPVAAAIGSRKPPAAALAPMPVLRECQDCS